MNFYMPRVQAHTLAQHADHKSEDSWFKTRYHFFCFVLFNKLHEQQPLSFMPWFLYGVIYL